MEKGGSATGIPLTVLVNEGSASAAEIVAAALQDAGRAQLVGQTTFGTGTVLEEFRLADGSSLLLAIEEWLTPAGRSFWHKGIKPNVEVALEGDISPLFPNAERGFSREQLLQSGDKQLLAAMESVARVGGPNAEETLKAVARQKQWVRGSWRRPGGARDAARTGNSTV